jgi:hypothetical protein
MGLLMWGTLSDERSAWPYLTVSIFWLLQSGGPDSCIYFPQEQISPVTPLVVGFAWFIYILLYDISKILYTHTRVHAQHLFQSRLGTADYTLSKLAPATTTFTWTVICMTSAKCRPLIFSVMGFYLSNIVNTHIFMILYHLGLLPV